MADQATGLLEGLVISHLGQGIAVEHEAAIYLCQTLRKLETVAVGDRVIWSPVAPGQGRIEEILPRRSLLARPSRNNKIRPVAANIDTIYVVVAVEPACDFLLLDQYLAVSANNDINAAIIVNKIDLPQSQAIDRELDLYRTLGYCIHQVSTRAESGISQLKEAMNGQTSVLTGQSGVGKSSIVNTLAPGQKLRTNSISETTKHGRHTTTAATLYHLEGGGDLIDSPGVAIFGLADLTREQLAWGYLEFRDYFGQCRFNDCRHHQDLGCAVRQAAESNEIAQSRYQRFLKLTGKMNMR
jgi:ribosome biogenesis GTPase / thiamine phosphate phosphatase